MYCQDILQEREQVQLRNEEEEEIVIFVIGLLDILIITSIEFIRLLLLYSNRILYTFCATAAAAAVGRV